MTHKKFIAAWPQKRTPNPGGINAMLCHDELNGTTTMNYLLSNN